MGGAVDTVLHTMDKENQNLNINQTNNSTTDTANKVCLNFLIMGDIFEDTF